MTSETASTTNLSFRYNKNRQLFTIIKIAVIILAYLLKYSFPDNLLLNNILFVFRTILLISLISDYLQSKRLTSEVILYNDKIQLPFRIPNQSEIVINFGDVKNLSLFSTFKRTLKISTPDKTYVLEERKMRQDDFNMLVDELNKRVNLN